MSSETKHTPGPWHLDIRGEAEESGFHHFRIEASELGWRGDEYLSVFGLSTKANAYVLWAAPELLEAVETAPVLSKYHGQNGFEVERFIADYEAWDAKRRAAIARATGQEG